LLGIEVYAATCQARLDRLSVVTETDDASVGKSFDFTRIKPAPIHSSLNTPATQLEDSLYREEQ